MYQSEFPPFFLTADLVIFRNTDSNLQVLLVRRGNEPFKGMFALPGGFVNIDEDALTAAVRELREETDVQVEPEDLSLVGFYSTPDRDPRGRIVSAAYVFVESDEELRPVAGDDAVETRWIDVREAMQKDFLAFDHRDIVMDALEAVSRRLAAQSMLATLERQIKDSRMVRATRTVMGL